ncbi:radical SAM/SPASM domain-containing protein [Desulfogranum mediterraneum]|uniref:radical SAM/SPASM domain-containing protein n=1 Tax=Desulfogranum mediterraneum TaxID=160661 RepID=UPI0003F75624|nr:radical SAM protein [Desulfogranum mediterraneum]
MENKTLRQVLRNAALAHQQRLRRAQIDVPQERLRLSQYNLFVPITQKRGLLFNALTRATALLDSKECSLLISSVEKGSLQYREFNPTLIKIMAAEGFIISADVDELKMVQSIYNALRYDKTSLTLTIAPTMECNFACSYCFQGLDKKHISLTSKTIDGIKGLIQAQADDLKHLSITWYGGEPLLKTPLLKELADELINICQDHHIDYSSTIVTNGYFLDAATARQLLERYCNTAQITIDGTQAVHDAMRPKKNGRGTYSQIMSNIAEVLTQTEMNIIMRVNVGKENLDECGHLLTEIETKKFHQFNNFTLYFAPIDASTPESGSAFGVRLDKQDFYRRINAFNKRGRTLGVVSPVEAPGSFMGMCVAAKDNGYVVAANGELHKCWETMHDTVMRIGSLPERESKTDNHALWKHWTPFDIPECRECTVLPLCGGMCPQRFVCYGKGGQGSVPCPEWKWNAAELIFLRAREKGYVTDQDWAADENTAQVSLTGTALSPQALAESHRRLHLKVTADSGR